MSVNASGNVDAAEAPAQAAVESLSEAVKNTSIDPKPDTSAADAAHAASAAEGRRLYIGNLAYSTTDEQLKEFFIGFSIEDTSIPTHPRTGRAVGYAFVDLTTKEEADRAITELSGKEVLERKVSVQLARKPGTTTTLVKKDNEEGAGPDFKQGKGMLKRVRAKARGNNKIIPLREDTEKQSDSQKEAKPLVESTNVKSEQLTCAENSAAPVGQFNKHPKKKRGPPENGVPSATKIMVANLPYELTEDKLKELFAEYQPESAKIALRPIPRYMVRKLQARGEPRKGRGFGFVTLASEEMQKMAVEEMNGKIVDGREIAVKVAIDSQASDSEDKENTGDDSLKKNDKTSDTQNGVETEA